MSAVLIDGKAIAARCREQIREEARAMLEKTGVAPGLAVILVGEDPASQIYVRHKEKACGEVGFRSRVIRMPAESTQRQVLDQVRLLNEDRDVHGILVQMPLPKHLDEGAIIDAISPKKDVDGISVMSAGALSVGSEGFVSCTPKGVMRLLETMGVQIAGKRAVVIGRSNIVGKPTALLLLKKNATVTICHSRTQNLPDIAREADILIVAVGRKHLVKGDWIKPGAVVIDVGMNRGEGKKVYGDVDFESAREVASMITPVPGGVGPMTIAMLLNNTLEAAGRNG